MSVVFVDSGAWIALVKRNDQLHDAARRYYQRCVDERIGMVTTNYVVDEAATRLRYDVGLAAALEFRSRLLALQTVGRGRIVWIDEHTEEEGWRLMQQHADLRLSLTDATSAAVARAARLTAVYGFDRHFEALGFTVVPHEIDTGAIGSRTGR